MLTVFCVYAGIGRGGYGFFFLVFLWEYRIMDRYSSGCFYIRWGRIVERREVVICKDLEYLSFVSIECVVVVLIFEISVFNILRIYGEFLGVVGVEYRYG